MLHRTGIDVSFAVGVLSEALDRVEIHYSVALHIFLSDLAVRSVQGPAARCAHRTDQERSQLCMAVLLPSIEKAGAKSISLSLV